jgi:hypothetical protein
MQKSLCNINEGIITLCESHWRKQIEETKDIIAKLERNDKNKLLVKSISARMKQVRKDSENYRVNMEQALYRYPVKIEKL